MGQDYPERRHRENATLTTALPRPKRAAIDGQPGASFDPKTKILDAFDGLPAELRKAARYVADHPEQVAFESMRGLARSARLAPATMVRLAKAIGYPGFKDLRAAFQTHLQTRPQVPTQRAKRLSASHSTSRWLGAVQELIEEELNVVQEAAAAIRDDDLRHARRLLSSAKRVFVLGLRGMYPAAFCLCYSASAFSSKVTLVDGAGGTHLDALRSLSADDAVVVFTCRPYPTETLRCLEFVKGRGAIVIAITDGALSLAARIAALAFEVRPVTSSLLSSSIADMLLSKVMAQVLLSSVGASVIAATEAAESHLSALQIYGSDTAPPLKRRQRTRES